MISKKFFSARFDNRFYVRSKIQLLYTSILFICFIFIGCQTAKRINNLTYTEQKIKEPKVDCYFNKTFRDNITTLYVIVNHNEYVDGVVFDPKEYYEAWRSTYERFLLKHNISVISPDKRESILKEQKFSLSGLSKTEKEYKIGELLNADGILYVNAIFKDEDNFKEEIKLISIKTGEVIFIGSFKSLNVEENKKARETIISKMVKLLKRDLEPEP